MNTAMRVKSMPPIRLSTLRAATTRACEAGPAPVQRVLVKESVSPRQVKTDKLMSESQMRLDDLPFYAALRKVKRMHAKAESQKYPAGDQRKSAELLLNIINR